MAKISPNLPLNDKKIERSCTVNLSRINVSSYAENSEQNSNPNKSQSGIKKLQRFQRQKIDNFQIKRYSFERNKKQSSRGISRNNDESTEKVDDATNDNTNDDTNDDTNYNNTNDNKNVDINEKTKETQSRANILLYDFFSSSLDNVEATDEQKTDLYNQQAIDPKDIRYAKTVGKRRDCKEMIFTLDENQIYGRNRVLNNGDIAYLCRLYGNKQIKCKSRLYMRGSRLFKRQDFIAHNHSSQEESKFEFEVEYDIKMECANLQSLVNAGSQKSAVSEIFDKHIKL